MAAQTTRLNLGKPCDADGDGRADFHYIVNLKNCGWFTVDIEVKNVGKMYNFSFKLMFNFTPLNTDTQHIYIKNFLLPPYESLQIEVYKPDDPWRAHKCSLIVFRLFFSK
jgi:hypothetical protein